MNIVEQRDLARRWIKKAAKAQDAEEPLKSVDEALTEEGQAAIEACQIFGMILVDEVKDTITVTIDGRLFAGIVTSDVEDFGPGKAAEVRGNIAEAELAARYLDDKVHGIEKHMAANPSNRDNYLWLGRLFRCAANEIRQGLHIPHRVIEGRVVPYNESNETGLKHAANLALFFADVHERNCRAGWWSDLETGEPKKRNVGELFMLFVTEIAEAYEAYVSDARDDKLPEYPGLGVELGDLAIRLADFAGAAMDGKLVLHTDTRNPGAELFEQVMVVADRYEAIRKTPEAIGDPETGESIPAMDIPLMIDAKLAFNAERKDHKIEERLKADGKKT